MPPLLVAGPSAVRAASSLRRPKASEQPVPFPWDLAPANSKPVYAPGSVASPAQGASVVIVTYQVPEGFQFALKSRYNSFEGAFVQGSGDILWTTDVNVTLGVTTPQGYAVEGMASEAFFPPFPIPAEGYLVFQANDIVRVKAANVGVGVGAPNFFNSYLLGWIWPDR